MPCRSHPHRLSLRLLILAALALSLAVSSRSALSVAIVVQARTSGLFTAGLSGAVIGDNGASVTATATDGSSSAIRFNSTASQINVALSEGDTASVTLGELSVTSNSTQPLTQAPNFGGTNVAVTVNFTAPEGTSARTFGGILTGRIASQSAAAEIQWMSPLSYTFTSGGTQLKLTIEPTTFLNQPPASVSGEAVFPIRAQLLLLKADTPPTVQASTLVIARGSVGFIPIATVSDQETPAGSLTVSATAISNSLIVSRVINNGGIIIAELRAACNARLAAEPEPGIRLTVTDSDGAASSAQVPVRFSPDIPPSLGSYEAITVAAGGSATILPQSPPGDNGIISHITATAPGFSGALSVNQLSGVISLTNAAPPGAFLVTVTATDNCGLTVARNFSLTVSQAEGTKTPNFTTVNNNISGTSLDATTAADFNQDGITDLAALNSGQPASVSILPGSGDGTFGPPVRTGLPLAPPVSEPVSSGAAVSSGIAIAPTFIEARDFNGDGKPDLIITSDNSVIILSGKGDGTFEAPAQFTAEGKDFTGDFNRDGRPDQVRFTFNRETSTGSLVAQLSREDGTFSDPVVTALTNGNGLSPQAGKFGDFNGDGRPDFAAITGPAQDDNGQIVVRNFQVSIYLGDAAGQFTHSQDLSPGTSDLNSLVTGDFNQDGLSDLITTSSDDSGDSHFFFLGSREHGLIPAGSLRDALPGLFRIGDFNADGRADLAMMTGDSLIIRSGSEAGVFSQQLKLKAGGGLEVGDFNHDGRSDLAVVNGQAGAVDVLLSTEPVNTPPAISAAAVIVREPGSAGQAVTIATVRDAETPAGSLIVTATSVPVGVVVSGISNSNGTITANVAAECGAAPGDSTVTLTVTDGDGLKATASLTVRIESTVLSAQTSVVVSGLIYDRSHRTFNGTITLTNISPQVISGPLRLELPGLNAGVGLVNATSLRCGIPFIALPEVTAIEPGQAVSVAVRFSNPGNLLLSFRPELHNSALFVPLENLPPPLADNVRNARQISPGRIRKPSERRVQ